MTVALRFGGRAWQGSARRDGQTPPAPSADYRVMSITKTFTAVLVLREVASGRLTLDGALPSLENVSAAVPEGVTVRRLLQHRTGLADYTEAPGFTADQPMTPQLAASLSLRSPLVAAPGTVTRYVNSNYLILGVLLEQLEHRSYPTMVAELSREVGLTQTRVDPPDRPGWAGSSSGGIMATVADMAAWGDALFTPGRIVSAETLSLMATTGDLDGGMGLWGVCPCVDGTRGIGRFTAIGHFTAAGGMFRFPGSGLTLVIKAEPATGDSKARAVALGQALLQELA